MQKITSNICYYDLETTGLCTLKSKILQIAAITNKNTEIFQSYVMTPDDFKITNSHIHHITKETLIENDASHFTTVMHLFIDWLSHIYREETVYLIAHNNFCYDQLVLESQCKEHGIIIPSNWRFYDSLYQFRKHNEEIGYGNYSLGKLYKNIISVPPPGELHNAVTDVRMLMQIHFYTIW